jgi:CheY-like chemotaxis protein
MAALRRVTVVNDSPEFLDLMAAFLKDANYPATLIDGDRDNATDLIEAAQPEILIIDLRLGSDDLKGLAILRWVKDHPQLRNVPAVVCTADKWALDDVQVELAGMPHVATLLKPFSTQDLLTTLRTLQPD